MRSGHKPLGLCRTLSVRASLTGRQRHGVLAVIALTLALTTACTTPTPPARPTILATSAPPTTSVATSPAARPGELSCVDAYTKEPRGSEPIAFTAAGVGFEALSTAGFDPVPAQSGTLPWAASGGYFSKAPVHLDKGVSWAEVTAIRGDVTFAWVPAGVWMGFSRGSGATYEAPVARFESCERSYTGFLGGILTPTAHACVTLGIRSDLHPEVEPMRVAIGKGSCR